MSIKNVKIKKFTVFNDADIDFASGINVIIGENGTGKTHLMKILYAGEDKTKIYNCFKSISSKFNQQPSIDDLEKIMHLTEEKITALDKHSSDDISKITQQIDTAQSALSDMTSLINKFKEITDIKDANNDVPRFFDKNFALKFHYENDIEEIKIFIPAKDMLTHSKGFLSLSDKFDMPFDETYSDIISKSLLPNLKNLPEMGASILTKLEKIIGGKVIAENETFFIEQSNGRKTEFSMEAEGIKKIAILWQLIMNESITKGSVLFWDEPEANINPSLISDVVEILLELSRQGVQIFVATHNFIFAKYIEVLMNEQDHVAFHALYKTENEGVRCETKEKFTLLTHNAIREENINIYDAEMKKEME